MSKTPDAVLSAFNKLVLKEGNDDIRVADVVRESEVSRSAFYNHFNDVDDLLLRSMHGIFRILAGVVNGSTSADALLPVLLHFQENCVAVLGFFRSPSMETVIHGLSASIEGQLPTKLLLPGNMVARQVAETQLSLIHAWLESREAISAETISEAMFQSIPAMLRSYKLCQ